MKYFVGAAILFSAIGFCFAQTTPAPTQAAAAFSESIEFKSQIETHFSAIKNKKVESYSLPEPKLGEEMDGGPITLSVSVLDANGRPISDLAMNDFSVSIDGIECGLRSVEKVGTPVHVIFLLDRSPSSGDLLRVMLNNAKALLRDLPLNSIVSVATFSSTLKFKAKRSQDKVLVTTEFDKIKDFEDGTSLYDALKILGKDPALNDRDAAVVLLTDGVDTTSRNSLAESFAAVERAKFAIYPVYLDTYAEYLKSRPATGRKPSSTIVPGLGRVFMGPPEIPQEEWEIGKMYLNDIASLSSGRPVAASIKDDVTPFDLGHELSARYSVTCSPTVKYRLNQRLRVQVRVAKPSLVVLTRSNFVLSK